MQHRTASTLASTKRRRMLSQSRAKFVKVSKTGSRVFQRLAVRHRAAALSKRGIFNRPSSSAHQRSSRAPLTKAAKARRFAHTLAVLALRQKRTGPSVRAAFPSSKQHTTVPSWSRSSRKLQVKRAKHIAKKHPKIAALLQKSYKTSTQRHKRTSRGRASDSTSARVTADAQMRIATLRATVEQVTNAERASSHHDLTQTEQQTRYTRRGMEEPQEIKTLGFVAVIYPFHTIQTEFTAPKEHPLCASEDAFLADAMYEYRCAAYSGTEAFTNASCPQSCHAGEDPDPHDEAYRFYCYCPVSSYEECVEMLPGREGKGPALNQGAYCSELVARSLDGATCETRRGDIDHWAQTCCMDKTSLCSGVWISPPSLCTNASV